MLINDKVDAVFIPDSPSRIKATDYNQIKNEIQECITEAGLTPTKDVIQLPQALRIMTAQSGAEEVAKIEAAGQTQLNAINTAGAQAVQDAQTAANTATTKATEAASSASAAASSASAASGSANTATTQATNSANSAALAQKWATQTTAEVVSGQGYGAKYYADQAADSAASIVGDVEAAAASATAAAGSASAAAQSAQDAADSAASVDSGNLAKVDLSNVPQLPQSRINAIMPANMDYVVESGSRGSTWYRKYKSGWIEQGGYTKRDNGGGDYSKQTNVTFLKAFTQTPLQILVSPYTPSYADGTNFALKAYKASKTGFVYFWQGGDNRHYIIGSFWYACGK